LVIGYLNFLLCSLVLCGKKLSRSKLWQPQSTTIKTPTSPPSKAKPSPSSATARKATRKPKTSATAASNVVIGPAPRRKNYDLAISHGFQTHQCRRRDQTKPTSSTSFVPDELQGDLFKNEIEPNLKPGAILMCSHGFNVNFGFIKPPKGVDALLVAPKGPGHLVRKRIRRRRRRPLPHRDERRRERRKLSRSASPTPKAIGGTRGGAVIKNNDRRRKPKPTSSASKPFSAAARAPL